MPQQVAASLIAGARPGAYAVGVSGGADSVALLHLLHHHRRDVRVHVVHLDHETRGGESGADAAFVCELAKRWGLPHTIARRSDVERRVGGPLPTNRSARFRAVRHQLFGEVVGGHNLQGVMLAHHADDQAETVLHRLLRGAHAPYVSGMTSESRVKSLLILRPLLHVPRAVLRTYLVAVGEGWREDASNASPDYLRNRLRIVLERHPALGPRLLDLHESLSSLKSWVREGAPRLEEEFAARSLHGWPTILAAEAGRRWLAARGVPPEDVTPAAVTRLVEMATDAATPSKEIFAGQINVSRRNGRIQASS